MGMTLARRASLLLLAALLYPTGSVASSGPLLAQDQSLDSRPARAKYVGDAACLSCHKEQALPYQHTSHHLTSQLADAHSVLGSFRPGSNELMISDPAHATSEPGLYFRMDEKSGSYHETAVAGWQGRTESRTERIDVVTGSGVRGATYLYWDGDRLYELPVSYWTDGHQWINSPGYDNGTARFSRPINPGCLECHATYIKALSPDPLTNRYERDSLITGISCENCHGPGADHIAKQKAGASGEGQAILNPAKFSRDRQVDLCALCHNGIQREAIAPVFSYVPGEPLTKYFKPLPIDTLEHPDVHGNQVGLLQRSRCYLSSKMTCSTCHDVHAPERPAAAYSDRCLTCHLWESCAVAKTMGHKIANDCIDCHMPVEPTNVIVSETGSKVVRAKMRNHWIKVYRDARMPETGTPSRRDSD
jgi:hypothetical protein